MAAIETLARGLALGAALLVLAGCGSTTPRPVRPEVDLHHPSATRRLEAIAAVARSGDPREVPALIGLLEDPDVGVRLAADQALTTVTGHTVGYRPYGDEAERARAVAAWRAWWAGREAGAPPPPGTPRPSGTPAVYTGSPTHVDRP